METRAGQRLMLRFLQNGWYRFTLYTFVGLLVLGPIVWHPFSFTLGGAGDPQQFEWYLGWFWYAVLHGHNPLFTNLLNAPVGQNLMWNTSVLAESIVFGPLALWLHGTFVYNLLWLINFIVSCVLGRRILIRVGVRMDMASCGALLFGILPYTTSQSLFHLHLWMTSILLAIILVAMRGIQTEVAHPAFLGIALGVLLTAEFYTSLEVFATMVMTTTLILVLALILTRKSLIAHIHRKRVGIGVIAILTFLVLTSPGLYELFEGTGRPSGALLSSGVYVNDALNFVLPTLVYLVHLPQTNAISAHYTGNFWENDGYLGIPAILMWIWSAKRTWYLPAARVAICAIAVLTIFSMGPSLHVDGHVTSVWLPWSWFGSLPLLSSALPSRLSLYADILLVIVLMRGVNDAVQAQSWSSRPRWALFTGMALVFVTWMPRIPYSHTSTLAAVQAFSPSSPVYQAVENQTTYVLTPFFPQTMQVAEQAGYPISMVNPYGYTTNDSERDMALQSMHSVLIPSSNELQVRQWVGSSLSTLQATRLMYVPIAPEDHLTSAQLAGVNDALGQPVAMDDGVIVWEVSASR